MSNIEAGHQQNPEIPDIVDREQFTIELKNYYSGHNENSKKLEWTNDRIQNVIKLLEEYNTMKLQGKRVTSKQYHHASKYELMKVDNKKVLIFKRKNTSDPVIRIIPTDEYYERILEAHIASGHGRRDKIVHMLKNKYLIPIFAISIFINLCKICLSKKIPKRATVNISNDFNRMGRIDLVDFQWCPDREYKWLLQYQDDLTKFCFLRPLKGIEPNNVAIELIKIFLEVGCPNILQCDVETNFKAVLLREIITLWPACKIVYGRPRYLSEGIEHSKEVMKNMIVAWMEENKSTNWSIGCHFVQFQKNSSHHTTIGRTPYKALFGADPNLGLSLTSEDIISQLETDGLDLEGIGNKYTCMKCKIVYTKSGTVPKEDGYNSQFLCNLCINEHNIVEERKQLYVNMKRAADNIATSSKKLKDSIGSVCIEVTNMNSPLDSESLDERVLDERHGHLDTTVESDKDRLLSNAVFTSPKGTLCDKTEVKPNDHEPMQATFVTIKREEDTQSTSDNEGTGEPDKLPFAEHVNFKLLQYSLYVRNQVEYQISLIFYQADMGCYNRINDS